MPSSMRPAAPIRPASAWVTVAFTYNGLKALGVPQESLDSFAPEFRQGMAARAAELGDVGDSAPEHWESPLGTPDVHVAMAVLSPDAERLEAVASAARRAHEQLPGVEVIWRQDCYQLPTGRTSFGFKDGIGQPAIEGSGIPAPNPHGAADQGRASSFSVTRTRRERCRRCRRRRCSAGTALTSSSASSIPASPRTAGTSASSAAIARAGGAARREDGGPLAERRAARARPRRRRSRARRGPTRGTTRSSTATICAGFKCPAGAHARRANPRDALDGEGSVDVRLHRMIRRGTSYGPMLPEGVLEDDGVDRGHHLRVRRRAPEAPVRVRQDAVAQRRHLHRRPAGDRSAGRAVPPARARSRSRSGRSGAGCRTAAVRRSRGAASTASPPACGPCAGSASSDTYGRTTVAQDRHAPTAGTHWTSARRRPMPTNPTIPCWSSTRGDGAIAVITLNRPHADNAITTEMGARLTEVLETIAVRPPCASRSSPAPATARSPSAATSASART